MKLFRRKPKHPFSVDGMHCGIGQDGITYEIFDPAWWAIHRWILWGLRIVVAMLVGGTAFGTITIIWNHTTHEVRVREVSNPKKPKRPRYNYWFNK